MMGTGWVCDTLGVVVGWLGCPNWVQLSLVWVVLDTIHPVYELSCARVVQIQTGWVCDTVDMADDWLSFLGYDLRRIRVILGTSCLSYDLYWVRFVLGTSYPGYEMSWVRVVVLGTSCLGYASALTKETRRSATSWCQVGHCICFINWNSLMENIPSSHIPRLTHWGWVTYMWVSKLTTIGSDNGLAPTRRQAIIWPNAGILWIGP